MRVKLPLGRTLFFICAFLFCLAALLPLRLAIDWLGLGDRGLAAREANGSIWLGTLREAQAGPVGIGDVQVRLASLPLFAGRARVEMSRTADADPLEGAASVSRNAFGIDDVTGKLDAAAAFAPLPIASLDLDDVSIRYADGLCESAEGKVAATLAGDVAGLMLPGGLTGNARCDGGAALLPLVSQSGMEALNLRLFADGRHQAELAVRPPNPALRDRLAAAGFVPGPGGVHVLRVERGP